MAFMTQVELSELNSEQLNDELGRMRLMSEARSLKSKITRQYMYEAQQQALFEGMGQGSPAVTSESNIGNYDNNFVDPLVWMTDAYGSTVTPYHAWGSREEGRYRPFIENEQDLASMRSLSRFVCETNLYAKGILEDLTNFVIGNGLKYVIKSKDKKNHDSEIVNAVQDVIDTFVETNNIEGELDREAFARSRRDGETLLRTFHTGGGDCIVRVAEPEYLIEPGATDDLLKWLAKKNPNAPYLFEPSCWTFGVHSSKQDIMTRFGYFFEWERGGSDWEYVPDTDLVHIKENVDGNVKRGLSDFYPVSDSLRKALKLMHNTADGAAMQAGIGYITEFEDGVSQDGINRMVEANADDTLVNPLTGKTEYIERDSGGARELTIPKGRTYHAGPLGTPQGAVYIEVLQGALRAIASRWSMPEHMISSDASNNNYASILEAGSPFKKAIEAAQSKFGSRMSRLMWIAIRNSVQFGDLRRFGLTVNQLKKIVAVDVEAPTPEVTERDKETQRNVILRDQGLLSPRAFAGREGLDYDEEVANGAQKSEPSFAEVGATSFESSSRRNRSAMRWEQNFKGYP